ncbi:ABC transporter substrate-binding protein [Auraticoccus monumenti]|nr:extracellular solute-binding protein [Auraticoccus monumenti]
MRARRAPATALALLATGALALSACQAGDLGSADGGGGTASTTITFLTGNEEVDMLIADGLIEGFTAQNPDIAVQVETRPGGGEGDNIVKTRLATGDMPEVFGYNSGSLFQAINPQQNLVPLTDEPFIDGLDPTFTEVVTAGEDVYGAPIGTFRSGGVLYNARIYEELGLEVPTSWDEFMANNAEIKAAGIDPVIQSYQETWTSQLFVLGDFHNVAAESPSFAEDYTANRAKYSEEPAVRGFQHMQEVYEADYLNSDFASTSFAQGLQKLAEGEGVHYPMLTDAVSNIAAAQPDRIDDVGFFALPGDDPAKYGATVWAPNAVYIPTTTEGAELEAAKAFVAFVASEEGCRAQAEAAAPGGPFAVTACELPTDVPRAVQDLIPFFDEGNVTPALEFASPVKGPALEQITVEVGSGIRSAEDGAVLYDEDVQKQAEQLGLPGW